MPHEQTLRNPYVPKSIADSGIVNSEFAIGFLIMEPLSLETPMGPRIEQALRRLRFESDEDVTWKELGERVWARLGREKVDTSKISRIKNQQQPPSVAEAGAFAYELDVSPLWLCWEIGPMGRFPRPQSAPSTDLQRESPREISGEDVPANRRQG